MVKTRRRMKRWQVGQVSSDRAGSICCQTLQTLYILVHLVRRQNRKGWNFKPVKPVKPCRKWHIFCVERGGRGWKEVENRDMQVRKCTPAGTIVNNFLQILFYSVQTVSSTSRIFSYFCYRSCKMGGRPTQKSDRQWIVITQSQRRKKIAIVVYRRQSSSLPPLLVPPLPTFTSSWPEIPNSTWKSMGGDRHRHLLRLQYHNFFLFTSHFWRGSVR